MAGEMSFRIDASDAEKLMEKIAATRVQLVEDVKAETAKAAKAMRQTARGLAKSKTMPGLSRSIYTNTKQFVSGIEIDRKSVV